MSNALNWLWLALGSACVLVGVGLITKAYWLLFTFGWGLL